MRWWTRRRDRDGVRSRPWTEVDCWALDLEMSGLDARRDRIVAVGMVPLRDRAVCVGRAFATLVAPGGRGVPEGRDGSAAGAGTGVTIHHLLPSQLVGAPELASVVDEIDRRLHDAILVVHAGAIDLPFLRRAFRESDRTWPDPPVLDTLGLLRRHFRDRLVHEPVETAVPSGLGAARRSLGLPAHDAHDALSDAIATAELLLVLAHRLGARTVADLA